MNSTTTSNNMAICGITVASPKGETLYRGSITIPEASGHEFFDMCGRARAVSVSDPSKTNAASCKLVWGGLDGDIWMEREMDFRGVDWFATIGLWNRFADLERVVKAQAAALSKLERDRRAESGDQLGARRARLVACLNNQGDHSASSSPVQEHQRQSRNKMNMKRAKAC